MKDRIMPHDFLVKPVNGQGDRKWESAYQQRRAELLRSNEKAYFIRLKRLGIMELPKDFKILDLGCGDGFIMGLLQKTGYKNVIGFDLAEKLVKKNPFRKRVFVANCLKLPTSPKSFNVVLINGVLHHLKDVEQMEICLKEIKRVLVPGGYFMFCEPLNTLLRRISLRLLFSPLAQCFEYSRYKKAMLEEEIEEYTYWLQHHQEFFSMLRENGFEINHYGKGMLNMFVSCQLV
jgi:ubiquinone/menaquinone biosynthesis C-methylase UbiE